MPELPLPNDEFRGRTVIASVWLRDDNLVPPLTCLVLLLESRTPFFTVAELRWDDDTTEWMPVWTTSHMNIVPAVREYENSGGDY